MQVEELLAKITRENNGSYILIRYFECGSTYLTQAQKVLFPNVIEVGREQDVDEKTVKNKMQSVFVISSNEWPKGIKESVGEALKYGDIYVCLNKKLCGDVGELFLKLLGPGVVVCEVGGFNSLGCNCVIGLRNIKDFNPVYSAQVMSELPFSRVKIQAYKKKEQDFSEKIKSLEDSVELSEKKFKLLKEENKELESEKRTALDRLDGEVGEYSKKINHLLRQYDEKISDLYEECEVLKRRASIEKKERDGFERTLGNVKSELAYHKDRSRQLAASFSYQFGNIFAVYSKSPAKLIQLPFKLVAFLGKKVRRKIAFIIKRRSDNRKVEVPSKKAEELRVKLVNENDLKLSRYLSERKLPQKWAALIGSEFLQSELLGKEFFFHIHPNSWLSQFENNKPVYLLVDAVNLLEDTSWAGCLQGHAYGYPGHIIKLLNFCKKEGIKTIFWNNASPGNNRMAAEVSALFDKIYVADKKELVYLRSNGGLSRERVEFLALESMVDSYDDFKIKGLKTKACMIFKSECLVGGGGNDKSESLRQGDARDIRGLDFLEITGYPVSTGYVSDEFISAVKKGCIPFTTKESAVNVIYEGLVPVISDADIARQWLARYAEGEARLEHLNALRDKVIAFKNKAIINELGL